MQANSVKIAVTGNLGSGKSTVSKILATVLAADRLDTDQLCRQQLMPGALGFVEFLEFFGGGYLQGDGQINRQLLRKTVFNDESARKKLESILHPIVRRQVNTFYGKNQHNPFLVVEVPLLYEVGWQHDFDINVVVYISEELCTSRIALRDQLTRKEIEQVLGSQLPITKKTSLADYVIDNSGTFVSTVHQINWLGRVLVTDWRCKKNENK